MTENYKRLSVNISDELDTLISDIADEASISRADVIRRALAVMKAYRQQKAAGREHIGFVSDPKKLEAEIINIL